MPHTWPGAPANCLDSFTKSRIFVHSVLGLCYSLVIAFGEHKRTLSAEHLEANVSLRRVCAQVSALMPSEADIKSISFRLDLD